jgi:hypothetical protein
MDRTQCLRKFKAARRWLSTLAVYDIPPVIIGACFVYVGTLLPDVLGIDRSTLAGFDALFVRSLVFFQPIAGVIAALGVVALVAQVLGGEDGS